MIRLSTLGATDLRDRFGRPVRDVLAQPKRVALLVYLAVEGRRSAVTRDRLLAMFWPESDASRARNTLSQALHHLRQALGPGVLESEGLHAIGVAADRLWCDAVQFAEAVERGDAELALDLYRGEFCPTLFVSGAPDVEEWLDAQRRRLRGLAQATARTLAERLLCAGDAEGAARAARRGLALRPDEEGEVRALLTLLERAGDGAGALHAYKEYERHLAAELETEPAPETRQVAEAIRRRREQPSGAASLPAAAPTGPGSATAVAAPAAGGATARTASLPSVRVRRGARWRVGAIATLAVAAAAVLVATAVRPARTPAPASAMAVFPFNVRGGAGLAYLREGMVDLLSAKLDGAAGIRAIDPHAAIAATRGGDVAGDPKGAARAARALGAKWYVTGDVVESAGRLQIVGSLADAGGNAPAIAIASVVGDTSALFQLVDDLTGRLLAGMTHGRDTTLTALAAVTTNSLPALKAFLAGEQALRLGRDAQAGASFREAALLDTTFALAQYRLAITASWVTVPDVADPTLWAEKAARHAERLPPLARDLVLANQAYREARADESERRYREIVEGHPENVEAWLMLGEVYFHYNTWRGRAPMEAWPAFQRALELDSINAHAMVHLARLAASEGRARTLDSLVRRFLARFGDAERTLEMRALQAYMHGDASSRAALAAEVGRSNPYVAFGVIQASLLFAQRLEAAADLAAPIAAVADSSTLISRRMLSEAGLGGGRWGDGPARRLLGAAAEVDWLLEAEVLLASDPFFPVPRETLVALRDSLEARHAYAMLGIPLPRSGPGWGGDIRTYLLGLLAVRLGDVRDAARKADALAAVHDPRREAAVRGLARALRAEILRSRGDPQRALAELEGFDFGPIIGTVRDFAHWGIRERFLKAELLHALGRDREALPWYDSYLNAFDLPWVAAAHLRRAEIYERLGNRDQARFHYARFVTMWKDCDPAFRPMVERALAALARLGGTPG